MKSGDDVPSLPSYRTPPLVEVVCGLGFEHLPQLQEPHFALLWTELTQRYPRLQVQPPLPDLSADGEQTLRVQTRPAVSRFWYDKEGSPWLLQLQQNRLLVNWRLGTVDQAHDYPRFAKVYARFAKDLETVTAFLGRQGWAVKPTAFELEYFGHLPAGPPLLPTPGDVTRVVPWLSWPEQPHTGALQKFRWQSETRPAGLPGRLHTSVHTSVSGVHRKQAVVMEIHAIGKAAGQPMKEWFDTAHVYCVQAFAELTDERVQIEHWGRETPDES